MTLLQQLEDAGSGGKADADAPGPGPGRPATGLWRGLAFTIEDLNLVTPDAGGLRVAPGREAQLLPLPWCREWVRGMLPVGGEIYTVIDFARFIGRRPLAASRDASPNAYRNASLLLMPGDSFNSALLLDSRISSRTFSHDWPQTEVADFDPALAPFLSAVLMDGGQPWGVLDTTALMGSESFIRIGCG